MGNIFIPKAIKGGNRTKYYFVCLECLTVSNQRGGYTRKSSLALLKTFRLERQEDG